MGIKDRRERERQEVKAAILAAARGIAAREGWQAVTIRKVAERIEYSPPMIYEHFASKEAILETLIHEGFRLLLVDLQVARAAAPTPDAALLATARAYWDFAWAHPELYQLMHGLGGVPFSVTDDVIEATTVFETTEDLLQAVFGPGALTAQELDDAVHLIWATLHGLVALTMAGHYPTVEKPDRVAHLVANDMGQAVHLVETAIRQFLAGWRAVKRIGV